MTTATIDLWAKGGALVVVFGATIYLVKVWRTAWAQRRQELEALYRKFGEEPPPPVSTLRFIWELLSMIPMLLFFFTCVDCLGRLVFHLAVRECFLCDHWQKESL